MKIKETRRTQLLSFGSNFINLSLRLSNLSINRLDGIQSLGKTNFSRAMIIWSGVIVLGGSAFLSMLVRYLTNLLARSQTLRIASRISSGIRLPKSRCQAQWMSEGTSVRRGPSLPPRELGMMWCFWGIGSPCSSVSQNGFFLPSSDVFFRLIVFLGRLSFPVGYWNLDDWE